MKARYTLAAGAAIALAACGSSEDAAPITGATTEPPLAMATPEPAAPMATTPQGFVDTAAASDQYEIEAGKLAQENGKSQPVKDFGAMMVQDHTKSSNDLKAAAGNVQGVTVNPQLTAMQKSNLDALRNAGDNFDTLYKQQQVAAHEQALSLMRSYAETGDAQPLKDFAAKAAPIIDGHLTKARALP